MSEAVWAIVTSVAGECGERLHASALAACAHTLMLLRSAPGLAGTLCSGALSCEAEQGLRELAPDAVIARALQRRPGPLLAMSLAGGDQARERPAAGPRDVDCHNRQALRTSDIGTLAGKLARVRNDDAAVPLIDDGSERGCLQRWPCRI